jgi:hypothetical protein
VPRARPRGESADATGARAERTAIRGSASTCRATSGAAAFANSCSEIGKSREAASAISPFRQIPRATASARRPSGRHARVSAIVPGNRSLHEKVRRADATNERDAANGNGSHGNPVSLAAIGRRDESRMTIGRGSLADHPGSAGINQAEEAATDVRAADVSGRPVGDVPDPVVADVRDPAVAGAPDPAVADVPDPAVADVPDPLVADVPDPLVADVPDPLVADVPDPAVAGAPDPAVADVPDPAVAGAPDPVAADVPDRAAADAQELVVADVPDRAAADALVIAEEDGRPGADRAAAAAARAEADRDDRAHHPVSAAPRSA